MKRPEVKISIVSKIKRSFVKLIDGSDAKEKGFEKKQTAEIRQSKHIDDSSAPLYPAVPSVAPLSLDGLLIYKYTDEESWKEFRLEDKSLELPIISKNKCAFSVFPKGEYIEGDNENHLFARIGPKWYFLSLSVPKEHRIDPNNPNIIWETEKLGLLHEVLTIFLKKYNCSFNENEWETFLKRIKGTPSICLSINLHLLATAKTSSFFRGIKEEDIKKALKSYIEKELFKGKNKEEKKIIRVPSCWKDFYENFLKGTDYDYETYTQE